MNIALDTNTYSALQRGHAPQLKDTVSNAELVGFVFIVDAELKASFKKSQNERENYAKLLRFQLLDRVALLSADEQTNGLYAKLWAELEKNGTPIPTNAVWIAATCLQHQLALTTSDKHLKSVPLPQTVPADK